MKLDTTKLINSDLIETNNVYDKIVDIYGFDVTLMRTTLFNMFTSLMNDATKTIEFDSIYNFTKSYHENTNTGMGFETLIKNYLIKTENLSDHRAITTEQFIRSSIDKSIDDSKDIIFNNFEKFFDIDLINACRKNIRYKYDIAQCLFRLYLLNKDILSQQIKQEVIDYYSSFYSVLFASIDETNNISSRSSKIVNVEINSLYGSIEQVKSFNMVHTKTTKIPVLKYDKPNVLQINLDDLYETVLNEIESKNNCKIKLRSFWNDEIINKLSFNVDTKNSYCKTMSIDFNENKINDLLVSVKKGNIISILQRDDCPNTSVFYPITDEGADNNKRLDLNFYTPTEIRLDRKPHKKYSNMDVIDIVFCSSVNGTTIKKVYYPVKIEFLIEGYYNGEEALVKNKYAPFISECYRRVSLPDFYLGKFVVNCYVEIENKEWDKDGKIDWIEKHIDSISADGRYVGMAKDDFVKKSGPVITSNTYSLPIVQSEKIENNHEKVEIDFYNFYKNYKDKFNALNIKPENVRKVEIDKNQNAHIPTELVIHVNLGLDDNFKQLPSYSITIADKSVKTLWDDLFIQPDSVE